MKNKLFKSFTLFLSFTMVLSLALSITTTKLASAAADNTWYYNELNAQQKAFYTILYNKLQNTYSNTSSNIVFNITSSDLANVNLSFGCNDDITPIVQPAYNALIYDHPELFWINYVKLAQFGWSCSSSSSGSMFISVDNMIIDTINVSVPALPNSAADKKKIDSTISNYAVTGSNNYEKLKNIHDYLANKIAYPAHGTNLDPPRYHNIAGALVDNSAVCEGYSKAFKILCDKAGIPCVLASGTLYGNTSGPHMWDCVKMEDGNWYAVDVTLDDQDPLLFYDYFLSGSNTVATSLVKQAFNKTHVPDNSFSDATPANYPPPTLSSVAYSKNTNNTMPDTTTIDTTTSPDTTLYNPDTTSTLQSNTTNTAV